MVVVAPAHAVPIPQDPRTTSLPQFVGSPATPNGFYAPDPPRHPFMAANGRSELHTDAFQTDTNQISGPLGKDMRVTSTMLAADCGSLTFDRRNRIVAVCVSPAGPTLYMLDPASLDTLATMALPPRQLSLGALNIFQDFSGGGYFYLDNSDRVVVPTTDRHVYVIAETDGSNGPGFVRVHDYDLTSVLAPGEKITSALPDWSGRIWVESLGGVLVTIDPANGTTRSLKLGEETENSFAVDETGGVYVVSDKALYRLDAATDGTPQVTWREVYPNSGVHKPGQVDAGSGTTPTVQGPYVTITDNADPLEIVVYRRARSVSGNRRVCVQPVFAKGAGADENSIIGAGNTMIVENNYGYTGPLAVQNGATTSPGIARVDIAADGSSCRLVWSNDSVTIPSTVSKVSLAAGLMYGYTKAAGDSQDPWYFTAIDVRTGRVVYQRLAGAGFGFNNNYAPVTIGPDGTAYVGVLAGLVALRDATPPQVPLAQPPHRVLTRALQLRLRRLQRRRLRVTLGGTTTGAVRVRFTIGSVSRTVRWRPFSAIVSLRALHRGRSYRVAATVTLQDGSVKRLVSRVRVPRR